MYTNNVMQPLRFSFCLHDLYRNGTKGKLNLMPLRRQASKSLSGQEQATLCESRSAEVMAYARTLLVSSFVTGGFQRPRFPLLIWTQIMGDMWSRVLRTVVQRLFELSCGRICDVCTDSLTRKLPDDEFFQNLEKLVNKRVAAVLVAIARAFRQVRCTPSVV
jgi:hypothetical protein